MDIFEIKDGCRANFNKYLRQALDALPDMRGAHLLDVGCGTGVSLCEMARITNWRITAVETDAQSLDILRQKISRGGWQERFTLHCGRAQDVRVSEHRFDVILAEGLFNIIGFETGLKMCDRLLKRDGWLILHDEGGGRKEKLSLFAQKGYDLHCETVLGRDVWHNEYIACLREKTGAYIPNSEAEEAVLSEIRSVIALYDDNPAAFESVCYVLQKREAE